LTEDIRTNIEAALVQAFKATAENKAPDMPTPDCHEEQAAETIAGMWDEMDDDQKLEEFKKYNQGDDESTVMAGIPDRARRRVQVEIPGGVGRAN
jgi:hypothetical protein